MYPMMKYCYEHDEWAHADKQLEVLLVASDNESEGRVDSAVDLQG